MVLMASTHSPGGNVLELLLCCPPTQQIAWTI